MTMVRVLVGVLVALVVFSGCATGDDAAVYGGSFSFTSPGGTTDIRYEPDERGTIGALAGPDLMGDGQISVSDFAGRVVAINFWGSWCGPCREEQDNLSLIATELEPLGVQFLGVDVRDSRSDGQDFYRHYQVPYPSIFDSTMRTLLSLRGYPATAIPSMIVLDREHRVAQVWLASAIVPTGAMKARIAEIAAEGSGEQ